MFLIPTILQDSTIHGLGVFASRDLQPGELVWRFDARCDFRRHDFPEWLKKFVFTDALGPGLDGDNARFLNHAEEPNLIDDGDDLVTARFVPKGEELTLNYRSPNSRCELAEQTT